MSEAIEIRERVEKIYSEKENYLKAAEDQLEINDNNFDGVINNVEVPKTIGEIDSIEKEKQSVYEKLHKETFKRNSQKTRNMNGKMIQDGYEDREVE